MGSSKAFCFVNFSRVDFGLLFFLLIFQFYPHPLPEEKTEAVKDTALVEAVKKQEEEEAQKWDMVGGQVRSFMGSIQPLSKPFFKSHLCYLGLSSLNMSYFCFRFFFFFRFFFLFFFLCSEF